MPERKRQVTLTAPLLLSLLVVTFIGLGITYSLMTPCFEAPDEAAHLNTVRYLGRFHTLPPPAPSHRVLTGADVASILKYHEDMVYYSPPLYYALAALLTAWTDMNDLPYLLIPNPNWERGWAPQANQDPRNKNVYAHRAEESLFRSTTVQATYLLRAASLMLGVVTILSTYGIARLLCPERPILAVGASAFVALNPQFIALSSGVTNDTLLIALSSLWFLRAIQFMQRPSTWREWAILGGLAGLALLTKQSALLLLPLGYLAALGQKTDCVSWRKVLLDGTVFLLTAAGVGGWWYIRGAVLYGDPLGFAPHFAGQVPLSRFGLTEMWGIFRSYWAAFGWALILVEPSVYAVIGVIVLAALAGILWVMRPGGSWWSLPIQTRRGFAILALSILLNGMALVRWATATGGLYGRLLFPTIAATATLSTWGLAQWTNRKIFRWSFILIAGLALLFAAIVPWRYLRPAFASPLLSTSMPSTAHPLDIQFQNGLRLIGYEVIPESPRIGRTWRVLLYWQAEQAPGSLYRAFVQLGPQDPSRYVAGDDTWLGGTLYPSELWRPGDIVRHEHLLSIPQWAPAPGLYWIRLGLVDEKGRVPLASQGGDTVVLGPWRLLPIRVSLPAEHTKYRLDSDIWLLGYRLEWQPSEAGSVLQVTLYWQTERSLATDYTVFVHLMDGDGNLLAQHDSPPRNGAYPTSWWLPGQIVPDIHPIGIERPIAGQIRLRVGMYDPVTLHRLPAYDERGQRLPEDVIPLFEGTYSN